MKNEPTTTTRLLALGLLVVFAGGACDAQDRATAPAAKKEATVAAATTEAIKASNTVTLRKMVGKEVTVHGRIGTTAKSRGGSNFLNFASSELSVVCFKENVTKFDAAPADTFKAKDVLLTGTLELYKGKLQIKLTDPAQIKIADAPEPEKLASIELKSLGGSTWISPAGLRYSGRDPAGLTRVEHIMRHSHDIPSREGPHGVFDANEEGEVFALIDEAWRITEKYKLRAVSEGDRSTYTVDMRRRIGFLGGSSGKGRGNPELKKVFIVFETGTKNIITAFPK